MKGLPILFVILICFLTIPKISAWSNGGWSADPYRPSFGTHDWIAEHALEFLPDVEKQYITGNLASYLYGTELPDNANATGGDGIGDTLHHHVYFFKNYTLQENDSAVRAQDEMHSVLVYLGSDTFDYAAKMAGAMSHYISDVAVFGHVMGSKTDWGTEIHHSDYENYVNTRMKNYSSSDFLPYIHFDGTLELINAYNATLGLAFNTTFGNGSTLKNCTWMDKQYDWTNTSFKDSCGSALNLSVNIIADVLHTIWIECGIIVKENGQDILLILPIVIITSVIFKKRSSG